MADLPAHVQRMLEERNQLQDRLSKLNTFIGTDSFITLDEKDQELLEQQAGQMDGYLTVLNCRLGRAFV